MKSNDSVDKASVENIQAALTPDRFREWLFSHKPGEVVGISGEDCDCPIARYLKDVGGEVISVSTEEIIWYGDNSQRVYFGSAAEGYRPVPLWVELFVDAVDSEMENPAIPAYKAAQIVNETLALLS